MSLRILACSLLLAAAGAQAANPPKKKAPPETPPQEIDVDAMARAKDADAQATAADAAAPTGTAAAEPAPDETGASDADSAAAAPESGPGKPKNEPPAGSAQDALALTPPIDPAEKRLGLACEARSTNLLDAAQKGDFAAASKDFDAKMRSAMPPAKFKETWGSLAQFGALQARGQSHPAKGDGYFIVMTPLIFEKTTLVAQVACGSDSRIAGFYVKPLSAVQPH